MASKASWLLLGLAAFLMISYISGQAACPTLFVPLNNRCYLFSEDEALQLDWAAAQTHCKLYTVDIYTFDLLVLDDDIEEPIVVSTYMNSKGYTQALVGGYDLGLSVSQWAWIDTSSLSLQSSIWDCNYPEAPTTDNVGQYVYIPETIDQGQVIDRFRMRNTPPTTVGYFICEGPLIPDNVTLTKSKFA